MVGEFVVALYVIGVVWLPALKHTLVALADSVIEGNGFTVIVASAAEAVQGELLIVQRTT